MLHLVDTPGIETRDDKLAMLADLALEADLLVLLARATQPARAADVALLTAIDERFQTMTARRRPPIVLVMTHADALPPRASWEPPYDLASGTGKAQTMREALLSVRDQLGLPERTPAIPVCLEPRRGLYNIDTLATLLMSLNDDAVQTQFNRRRLERTGKQTDWSARWQQMSGLGRALGRAVVRR